MKILNFSRDPARKSLRIEKADRPDAAAPAPRRVPKLTDADAVGANCAQAGDYYSASRHSAIICAHLDSSRRNQFQYDEINIRYPVS
jgi:hypothetical protein